MDVIHGIESITREPNSLVSVGSFDGLHLGHQRIFRAMKQEEGGGLVTIITFDPHPMSVIKPEKTPPPLLTTFEERVELFEKQGVDRLIIIPFNKEFAKIEAEDFVVKILFEKIGLKKIYTGPNHRFGREGKGNVELLNELGQKYGFETEIVEPVSRWGNIISSHRTRQALMEADALTAWRFLGRPFYISGDVVEGDGRGKKIGFPTANLKLNNDGKLTPPSGIYVTITEINGFRLPSVSHFGERPTFKDASPSIETHIIGFNGNLYGKKINIGLIDRLRKVEAYDSVPALVHQMQTDRHNAIRRLAELGFGKNARLRQQRFGKIEG